MHHIPRLSESVYVGMCRYVGTPTEVRIRREVTDTDEVVKRPVRIMRGLDRMKSGSRREGFRLQTSDVDWMVWPPDHKVIGDLSQISLYRIPQHTVILMECEDLTPGFARLKMMTPSSDQKVKSSCVPIDGEIYISSLLFKARFLDFNRSSNAALRFSIQHGPCATHSINEVLDVDTAYCFRSYHWPNVALPWIQRCQLKNWPPGTILSGIVKDGCHIVPIGSLPESDNEWRISFSGAEQKLIYSMNHCQFLCYGLLKVFLKEIIDIDPNNPSCLCSYFMKTILFWVIQCDRSLHWVPCNLLSCFWTCFKVLLSWVYKGECPNFFIPQNNMFRVKVVGQTQVSLFEQLYALYTRGILCLLKSPTIGRFLNMAILNRMLTFRIVESSIISDVMLDVCLYKEIDNLAGTLFVNNSEEAVRFIIAFEQLQNSALSLFQTVTTQYFLSELLKNFSFLLSSQAIVTNKKWKNSDNKALNMMKIAVKIGCVTQMLYLAIHYYRNCLYEESLRCLLRAQDKMSKPYVKYKDSVNEEVYRRDMAEVSLIDRMRKFLICDIRLYKEYFYIDELVPEQEANKADGIGILFIPPLVMLHMLFVLTRHRLGDTVRSQQSLQDLHTLLLYDDGTHVPAGQGDISWQILGICQQTCGDCVGALNSFHYSLQQYPLHAIQKATMFRMQTTNEHLF
uniref:Uncharacterized protein LOC111100529 n=1 Tax=Crassostrea virginica TaxID=6565 RepID=A0A8B8AE41_CRAVI|nr:uncharacterized protein LOC111100529 [Crassostrea virginica]XP_022288209.1 uncharacterized protein LOC111100529 [Crassostrea virginica]XP_022288210.1 uncharacterized protein LOC111100529 [Crassostrea virginica]XP_022288211.1 uncharacterized protein LOC111100529 [Crassostrea virginica]